jgi:hypothetical protein
MDATARRNASRIIVIALIIAIVGMFAVGVIHKINKELVQPGIMVSTPSKEAK